MRAAAVAVRARCFNPNVKPAMSTKPVEKVIAFDPVAKKPVRVMAKQVPSWEIIPTLFDEHVIAYRVMSHIRSAHGPVRFSGDDLAVIASEEFRRRQDFRRESIVRS